MKTNTLWFDGNLDVLVEHISDESVDLMYLDPLFNSKSSFVNYKYRLTVYIRKTERC